MLRYRCPHCSHLLQAHELRAGKKSVCVSCLTLHIIPIDRSAWLSESGESLHPRAQNTIETPATAAAADNHPETPSYQSERAAVATGLLEAPEFSPVAQGSPVEGSPPDYYHQPEQDPAILDEGSEEQADPELGPAIPHLPEPAEYEHSRPITSLAAAAEAPIQVQTQAQIAAALTEVLTHRMKPPRKPRQDLRLSTASWLVFTGIGIALLLVSLFSSTNYTRELSAIGLLEMLIGYGWIVWLTAQRSQERGIACAVFPLTCYYLIQRKYAKLRPLRFVLTGLALALSATLATRALPYTRAWVGAGHHQAAVAVVDPESLSSLDKLREYKKERAYGKLITLLQALAKTDPVKSVDSRDGPALAAEMKQLCQHPDTGIKIAAMDAYARWGGEDACEICLNAMKSQSQEERLMAIQLLPLWKNTESAHTAAQAIAALIGRPGIETTRGEAALIEIGGPAAERAAQALLLRSSDDATTQLTALSILDKVGGEESVTTLRSYANTSLDSAIKVRTQETIDNILRRMKKP